MAEAKDAGEGKAGEGKDGTGAKVTAQDVIDWGAAMEQVGGSARTFEMCPTISYSY